MAILRELLKGFLAVGALAGGVYWISTTSRLPQGNSYADKVAGRGSTTHVADLDRSADGSTWLSHSRGDFIGGYPLRLHSADLSEPSRPLVATNTVVTRAELFPDGQRVLIYELSVGLSLIDVVNDSTEKLLSPRNATDASALTVSGTGRFIAIAFDGEIVVYDLLTRTDLCLLQGHDGGVSDLKFSPEADSLISGGSDGTIRVWNLDSRETQRIIEAHKGPITSLQLIDQGRRCVSVGFDDALCIFDLQTGERLWRTELLQIGLLSLAISRDEHFAAAGGFGRQIILCDLRHQEIVRVLDGHAGNVRALEFSQDGKTLHSGGEDGMIHSWDAHSGRLARTLSVAADTDVLRSL